jgi:hypothetical protein
MCRRICEPSASRTRSSAAASPASSRKTSTSSRAATVSASASPRRFCTSPTCSFSTSPRLWPRPEPDRRDSQPHQGARQGEDGHPLHAHPLRGADHVLARAHHQRGAAGRRRHARAAHRGLDRRRSEGARGGRASARSGARRDGDSKCVRGDGWRLGVDTVEGDGPNTLGFELRHGADDVRRVLFETVVKHDLVLLELRRTQVSLEDTFRKLTDNRRAA